MTVDAHTSGALAATRRKQRQSFGESASITSSNKALHRTAFCAWGFALEFFLFIRQFEAVGELGRSPSP
jgi:hypothetical protein